MYCQWDDIGALVGILEPAEEVRKLLWAVIGELEAEIVCRFVYVDQSREGVSVMLQEMCGGCEDGGFCWVSYVDWEGGTLEKSCLVSRSTCKRFGEG